MAIMGTVAEVLSTLVEAITLPSCYYAEHIEATKEGKRIQAAVPMEDISTLEVAMHLVHTLVEEDNAYLVVPMPYLQGS